MIARIISILIGYCFGLIQTAYIYGKIHHIDIRKKGSGNAGATNTLRVLGLKAGLIVLFGDFFKSVLAVVVTRLIFKNSYSDIYQLLGLYAGLGCILGHCLPFYLGFHGGKGVASTIGVMATCSWPIVVFGFISFLPQYFITKYVSVSSMMLSAGFFVMTTILSICGYYPYGRVQLIEMCSITFIIMMITIIGHRENIKRLIAGEERKTYLTKKNRQ